MGRTMIYALQAFDKCPRKNPQMVFDVNDFLHKSSKRQTSHLEKLHLKALNSLVKEDMKTSVKLYDEILFDYPKDIFALNMSYFTSLYIGQRDLCRNIAGRVASAYKKSDRFYGSVHGKLCFG